MQEHLYCYVNSPYTIFVTNTHTHTHTHTQTHTGHVPLAVTLGSYFSHKSYMCTHTHTYTHTCTHAHTHTHTHTHTDWACTTCRDFGFLFLTLFSQIVHVHECTHLRARTHTHTHTQTGLVPLAETMVSYFSHCFRKSYMCMNVHTCAHTH